MNYKVDVDEANTPEYFSKEELKDAVELCIENAEQYIKDAELLIESSSFGHAYAFGSLAYEEQGKAAGCIFRGRHEITISTTTY